MPPAIAKNSGLLAIQLTDAPQRGYIPGHVVMGNVVRQVHLVSPASQLVIRLFGRTKVKLERSTGNSKSTYRSRYHFFGNVSEDTCQLLHQGVIHIPPHATEPQAWPFAIALPSRPLFMSFAADAESFLSTAPAHVESQPLPGTFYDEKSGFSTKFDCYVEYFLTAELVNTIDGAKTSPISAILPILVRAPPPTLKPILDFQPTISLSNRFIQSLRLIPELEHTELSFKQKIRNSLGTSKVPGHHFSLIVGVPSVMQLDNPNPIPFTMRIKPNAERTSESIRTVQQTYRLLSCELKITATTHIIAAGTFLAHEDTETHAYKLGLSMLFLPGTWRPQVQFQDSEGAAASSSSSSVQALSGPIYIPSGTDKEKTEALDVGAVLQLSVHPQFVRAGGSILRYSASNAMLYPDFVTYNIRHSHVLEWSVRIGIAGEEMAASGKSALMLLGPAQEEV